MPTASHETISALADVLERAEQTGEAVDPVRSVLGVDDIAAAYAVQRKLIDRRQARGGVVVGRKIGLTSPAVQAQLGVDQPDFGVLLADMDVSGRAVVPLNRLVQPKIEAEVAFVLAEDLATGDLDDDQVRASVDHAEAALEIVDSRVADWNIKITDTVADNASSGLFVLAEKKLTLEEVEPRDVRMKLFRDDELVSEGSGSACLGDPLNALAWLARTAREYGEPLRAGQIVLSGALGPMVPVVPGARFHAEIEPFGEVAATFSAKESA